VVNVKEILKKREIDITPFKNPEINLPTP